MKNSSTLYTIGTVPHPYTLTLLHYTRESIDANFLRREAGRDQWLLAATKEILGDQHTSEDYVVHFKEIVASPHSASNSLWLTAERVSHADLDWLFGFNLPLLASPDDKPKAPSEGSELVVFPRPGMPKPIEGIEVPEERWIKAEEERLQKARDAIKSDDKLWKPIVTMVEQWNLADSEAWRFARAWSARRRQERKKWEEEEQKYAGSERKSGLRPGGGGGLRWHDKM